MTTFSRPAPAWTFAITLVLAACNGNGGPTAPADGIRYTGAWILLAVQVNTGATLDLSPCPGSVTLGHESSTTLIGIWDLNATPDCDPSSGTLEGTLSDGEITIVLDPDPWDIFEIQVEECTILTRDDEFSGFLSGGDVSFDSSITVDCHTPQGVLRFRLTLLFEGTR